MVLLPVPYRTAQFFAFFLTTTAAYALPRATPAPALTPGPHVAGPPGDPQILPCTATIGVTYSRLPTPPYWPWCTENGGVERVYEATRTVQQQVDCRGCLAVTVETFPAEASCEDEYSDYYSNDGEDDDGYYAARPKKRTEAAVGTKTIYETVCSPQQHRSRFKADRRSRHLHQSSLVTKAQRKLRQYRHRACLRWWYPRFGSDSR
ncbi:unnamed protein product [Parascedosporium putredinis]|uniref:Uncharacterized protein n=1 Tax=Parascedosporium putredinis TaxID=1442378 RepID=A0A9P1M811_9PEZI|nr:unnamed protein product [Parascedosporium putredinis]CAI7991664.1 unnamed protein product [Parascedosporium putredinis]